MKKILLTGVATLMLMSCAPGLEELDELQIIPNIELHEYYKAMQCSELHEYYKLNKKQLKIAAANVDIIQKQENESRVASAILGSLGGALAVNQHNIGNYRSRNIIAGSTAGISGGLLNRGLDGETKYYHPRGNYLYLKEHKEAIQFVTKINDCNSIIDEQNEPEWDWNNHNRIINKVHTFEENKKYFIRYHKYKLEKNPENENLYNSLKNMESCNISKYKNYNNGEIKYKLFDALQYAICEEHELIDYITFPSGNVVYTFKPGRVYIHHKNKTIGTLTCNLKTEEQCSWEYE